MQIGMIGLGRMGANMVRRLLKGGHQCVVFDRSPKAVRSWPRKKLSGVLARGSREEAEKPRAVWLMVPGGGRGSRPFADLLPHLEAGDILIDGGNSYYIDDIRRAKELASKGIHYVDVGTSGGVWGLERGYCMMIGGEQEIVRHLDPIFATLAPGMGDIPRTPGREKLDGTAEQGYLHCGPNGAGHFVKMVHNGIEYGIMAAYAEGLGILRAANVGKQNHDDRCRDDAAARPGTLPVRPQSPRHRRGVAARQRDRLVAAGPDGGRARRGSGACRSSRAASPIPARGAGRSRPRSTRPCPRLFSLPLYTSASVPAAKRISRTNCSRPCAFEFGGHLEKSAK